jgi:hypothetical protein
VHRYSGGGFVRDDPGVFLKVTVIELCAYLTGHATNELPWRCVVCEKISKHSEDAIIPHLIEAHGLDKGRLKMEREESVYLYPPAKVKVATQ